jgi:Tfp pilus assembly protein FimT
MCKKSNNIYLSAFSVIETIVGLAVTAIISGIVFSIFSIITERMLDYKNQNQLVNDMNRLTYSINKDIFENEKMTVSESQINFNGYNGQIVKYFFNEEYTMRDNEVFVDTFKVQLNQMRFDSVKSKTEKIIFQKIKLNVVINKREMDLNFYKRVYANEMLQIKK